MQVIVAGCQNHSNILEIREILQGLDSQALLLQVPCERCNVRAPINIATDLLCEELESTHGPAPVGETPTELLDRARGEIHEMRIRVEELDGEIEAQGVLLDELNKKLEE